MTKQDDLIAYVFDGQPHPLAGELRRWMEVSTRFTTFVENYRDKIRKKARINRQLESALDLRGELEVAYRLLSDRRLELSYEPYASLKKRGPDFAVTYRANLVFNLEVARIRNDENHPVGGDLQRKEERILRVMLDKLGQMHPSMPNLLVIHVWEELARAVNLDQLMQEIKTKVEKHDASFYSSSRYNSPAHFYRDFLHLNGLMLWAPGGQMWINKQARPALQEKVLRLIDSLAAGQ